MKSLENILVVVQDRKDVGPLLHKASILGLGQGDQQARIHVVKVVYEGLADISTQEIDKSNELKQFILQSEEDELTQQIAEQDCKGLEIESAVLWNRRLWEGIVHAADAAEADVILKAAEEDGRGFIRTPDDWNLLRESKVPVFFLQHQPWHHTPSILVAIDALDATHEQLSTRILEHAAALNQKLRGDLHICSFYPLFEPWSAKLGLLQSYNELRKEIERDVAVAVNRLVRTVGAPAYKLHSVEGNPELGIDDLADEIGADIVLIGNRARDGLEALMIGNTAEKILHHIQKDVLTIN